MHVAGSAAVAQPQIDLSAFTAAANAATGMTLDPPFTYYANDINGLLSAYTFEDVGVTAYNGVAPLITSKALLAAAVGIGLIEGYHSGIVSINPCLLYIHFVARRSCGMQFSFDAIITLALQQCGLYSYKSHAMHCKSGI